MGVQGDPALTGENAAVRSAEADCREKNRSVEKEKSVGRNQTGSRIKKLLLGSLSCLGIAMAVYAGAWTWLCEQTGMVSWIGFAGCTTYFACGKKNWQGIKTAMIVNISGVAWAMASILLGRIWNWSGGTVLLCAWISYMIILQAECKVFSFIPGAYIGCFITFAAAGDLKAIVPAILAGVLLGWLTDVTGAKLYQWIGTDM